MYPFIITLTGTSGCGKSYVAEKIVELQNELRGINSQFEVQQFAKYSTREYREKEIKAQRDGKFVDVISVESIPPECDFVYLSYGKYYGFNSEDIDKLRKQNVCPIIVINDITALYNLRNQYKEQVLSLYVFQSLQSYKMMLAEAKEERGNVSHKEVRDRYEKATDVHTNFLTNRELFDRVIINNKEYTVEDLTKLQIKNTLSAILNGTIVPGKSIEKEHKLFIISGNAQSGKDDVIQGVLKMGAKLSGFVPKYTSRPQDDADDVEMVCKLIPKSDIVTKLRRQYDEKRKRIDEHYKSVGKTKMYPDSFVQKNIKKKSTMTKEGQDDVLANRWEVARISKLRAIKTPMQLFFKAFDSYYNANDFATALKKFYEVNDKYADIDHFLTINNVVRVNEETYRIMHDGQEYVIYENNPREDGSKDQYGFTVSQLEEALAGFHALLVASHASTFATCKEILGGRVVTVFAYSQVSKSKFESIANNPNQKAKKNVYDDLRRYAKNIAEFDHVLIYTESESTNKSNGLKETLIEQMFTLFRLYNKEGG